jgi:DNA-binding response OmpR family regulator
VPNVKSLVFVVDNEPVISQTLAVILNKAGFSALAFDDPFAAIAASEYSPPDLLIADVMMPGFTGIELAVLFRKAYPECKVLLFSGQAATTDLLTDACEQGYDFDVLAKPVHPSDLLAKLNM